MPIRTQIIAGCIAGAITGTFGSGGGVILVPVISMLAKRVPDNPFAFSLTVMVPICIVCLLFSDFTELSFSLLLPFLAGGILGGIFAALLADYLPRILLHRTLGVLILWGGIRCFLG